MLFSRTTRPALGTAPAAAVLESTLGPLVPRRLGGLVAVAVDGAGSHLWSTGRWSTLPSSPDDAPDSPPAFQIGSITKVFTAVLLARAVADGEVALDDPVSGLLVGGRPVTLRDLVTHRSGLPRLPRGARRAADPEDPIPRLGRDPAPGGGRRRR